MKKVICSFLVLGLMLPVFGLKASAEGPGVSAVSAVVIEAETGTVLFSKNMSEQRAMASTTKIMTAILTIEAGDLDREFTVDSFAIMVEGTSMGLREGDRVSRRDLLYGIMLPSGNDAANAAAVSVSGSVAAFVEKMNAKAGSLGLLNTHFANPSGLDANGHYTTAYDLARLTAYAMKNEIFREVAGCRSKEVEFGNPPYKRTLYNSNKMLTRYEGAIGVKPGFTDDARRCLVSAAERNGTTLIAVTLNAGDDWNDHEKMLNYGFSQVSAYQLETGCSAKVAVAGTGQTVGVYADNAVLSLTAVQRQRLERKVLLPRMVYGAVEKGQKLGKIEYMLDGKTVKSVNLYADSDVAEEDGQLSTWQKILRFLGF
ncbi:MAG: D-alanyl-D-alanine carboxypeptidase [Oscillospiraceae bacterium]|nr:D-alanyl-D-alanine carboxypeptidase [Oscillospiraceae bacterium]